MALKALMVSYSDVAEGGIAMSCEKKTQHPVVGLFSAIKCDGTNIVS